MMELYQVYRYLKLLIMTVSMYQSVHFAAVDNIVINVYIVLCVLVFGYISKVSGSL